MKSASENGYKSRNTMKGKEKRKLKEEARRGGEW